MSVTTNVGTISVEKTPVSTRRTRGNKHGSPGKSSPTKADAIIKRLRGTKGASVAELIAATGWQAHSIRGFISGTVRKRLGLNVETIKDSRGTSRYRIVPSNKD